VEDILNKWILSSIFVISFLLKIFIQNVIRKTKNVTR
jgi:hypothetical protein